MYDLATIKRVNNPVRSPAYQAGYLAGRAGEPAILPARFNQTLAKAHDYQDGHAAGKVDRKGAYGVERN